MADIGSNRYLVDPNLKVKVLAKEVEIQDRKSRIVKLKQDIEDLTEMAIKSKQAELEMLELEYQKLNEDLAILKPQDAEIIDIKKEN
jgi:hypothetical protein